MAVWGKGLMRVWMGMLMFAGGLYLQELLTMLIGLYIHHYIEASNS